MTGRAARCTRPPLNSVRRSLLLGNAPIGAKITHLYLWLAFRRHSLAPRTPPSGAVRIDVGQASRSGTAAPVATGFPSRRVDLLPSTVAPLDRVIA
jgi:hypothetical protein